MHVLVDPTQYLLNPTPKIPLTQLGDKNTAELKQLMNIFNTYVSPKETLPPTPTLATELPTEEAVAPT